jgi:GT2 family glycosyltransferase
VDSKVFRNKGDGCKMKYTCIVVIYNLACENSITLKSLKNIGIDNIIVCDNSVKSQIKNSNIMFCNKQSIKYLDMEGNSGLSKAYNRALKEIDADSWVVIFDQDTKIIEEYFDKLSESICKYPEVYMHVPIVKSKNMQMSPSISKGYNVKKINHSTSGVYKDITAINSGMAVKGEVFEKTGIYNENIFLDYLDHYFVREYKNIYKKIAVFDCVIIQDYSDEDHTNYSRDLNRFEIYSKDFYEYCKDSIKGRVFYIIKILYRSVKLSILHKNIAFIKIAIKSRKK